MGYENSAHVYDIFDDKNNADLFMHYGLKAKEILDIGAGTGRIAVELARKGIAVYAVEPSPAMRAEFAKKLAVRPDIAKYVHLIASDAASFKYSRVLPAAIMSGVFDHLLSDEHRCAALSNIHRHLQSGGTFVFDVFVGLMDSSDLKLAGDTIAEGRRYKRSVGRSIKGDNIVDVHILYEIFENDELIDKFEEHSLVGITNRSNIHSLLGQCGFDVIEEFADYDFRPYTDGEDLLIIEARKR